MEIILEVTKSTWHVNETLVVRLLMLNDSFEPVAVDRRMLIGPNVLFEDARGFLPVSVEPAVRADEQNAVILNPWCLYGRQRTFEHVPPGKLTLHGYLLKQLTSSLLPQGPGEADALLATANPVTLTIVGEEAGQ